MDTTVLTVNDVCARLRLGQTAVYKLIRDGRLRATKNPGRTGRLRVTGDDLDAYLDEITVKAPDAEAA